MIAQISEVSPEHFHQAALMALGLLAGAGTLVGIWAALRKPRAITPQPLQVEAAPRHPTDTEFTARTESMEKRLSGLEASVLDLQRVQREQLGHVHRRIDEMLAVVSRLGGVIEGVQEALRNLHHDLVNLRKR